MFSDDTLGDYLAGKVGLVRRDIYAMPAADLLQADDIGKTMVAAHGLVTLELVPSTQTVDLSIPRPGGMHLTVTCEFIGTPALLTFTPRRTTARPSRFENVSGSRRLVLEAAFDHRVDAAALASWIEQEIDKLTQWFDFANDAVAPHKARVEATAHQAIAERVNERERP